MTDLYPIPDAEGIAKTKEIYLNRFGKSLTDEQAAEILGRVMRFLFFVSELTAEETGAPHIALTDVLPPSPVSSDP